MNPVENSEDKKPLKIFLHIPKTTGVTIREILMPRLREDEVLHITDPESITSEFSIPDKIRLLHGYIDITIVNFLGKNTYVYTFLRDPLKRAILEYNFIK